MSTRKTYNWDEIREDFLNSNLSVEAFSKLNGFSKSSGHNHLNDIALKRGQMLLQKSKESDETSFIPLELSEPNNEEIDSCEVTSAKSHEDKENNEQGDVPIELKNGTFSLILHSGFNKDNLRSILEVLKESC